MFGESINFGEAGIISIFSILVVFVVLIAIQYLIKIVNKLLNKPAKTEAKVETKSTPAVQTTVAQENDDDLVAVITAAIAASLGKSVDQFVVKSITPVKAVESNWGESGRIRSLH